MKEKIPTSSILYTKDVKWEGEIEREREREREREKEGEIERLDNVKVQ